MTALNLKGKASGGVRFGMKTKNFLPQFVPRVYRDGTTKVLTCLARNQKLVAKPEELVRQRILNWLINDQQIPRTRLALEDNQLFTSNKRGRSDILVRNENGEPALVVEIKRQEIPLGDDVKDQAIRYAQKCKAAEIWITNGQDHRFFRKVSGRWIVVLDCEFLKQTVETKEAALVPSPSDTEKVKAFMRDLGRAAGSPAFQNKKFFEPVLSLQKLILSPSSEIALPFSHEGVHILEDRGVTRLAIRTPGGRWNTLYRIFLAATEGRVETVGIGLNVWDRDKVIICVAFLKEKRKHHALQLQITECCERDRKSAGYRIYHSGKMGGRSLPSELVFEGIREALREDLIELDPKTKKTRVSLGILPNFDNSTWTNSKEFISNIFHYAIIRTNLRESHPYEKPKKLK